MIRRALRDQDILPISADTSSDDETISPVPRSRVGPGGWWFLFEPEFKLGDDVFCSDLAGWRGDHGPDFPDTRSFNLAPDWVCYFLSRWTGVMDVTALLDIYGHVGTRYLWFIGPDFGSFEAFELQNGCWSLKTAPEADAPMRVAPFAEVAFRLSDLWPNKVGYARAPRRGGGYLDS